jgi:hypothetical protein
MAFCWNHQLRLSKGKFLNCDTTLTAEAKIRWRSDNFYGCEFTSPLKRKTLEKVLSADANRPDVGGSIEKVSVLETVLAIVVFALLAWLFLLWSVQALSG